MRLGQLKNLFFYEKYKARCILATDTYFPDCRYLFSNPKYEAGQVPVTATYFHKSRNISGI